MTPFHSDLRLPMTRDLTRREWLAISSLGIAGVAFNTRLFAQPAEKATDKAAGGLAPLNRFPRMMQEHLSAKVAAGQKLAELRQAKLTTKAEAEAHVQAVRGLIRESFGPFPERTPLKPRVTTNVVPDCSKTP